MTRANLSRTRPKDLTRACAEDGSKATLFNKLRSRCKRLRCVGIRIESGAGMEGYQDRTSVVWLLEATKSVVSSASSTTQTASEASMYHYS